jgi:beta-lactamase class D
MTTTTLRHAVTRRTLLALSAGYAAALVTAGRAHTGDGQERPDLDALFRERGVAGTFALYDATADRCIFVNRRRAETRYVPASTFKIANSLIALETGVVKDENEIVPYGGKPQPFKAWEKDMSMREAIAASSVPIYQELARRVELQRYHEWLNRLHYGNERAGEVVDRFWLDGPLEISAIEQGKFVARLAQGNLPASQRSQSIVRDIVRLESTNARTLYGKTGWLTSRTPHLGWWTGWVEQEGKISAFSLNIDMASSEDVAKRVPLGKALLAKLGVV